MHRTAMIVGLALLALLPAMALGSEISGSYLETRTCQVYTGPCFANAEVGIAGRDAIMAWNIEQGQHEGVDLTGLSVVMVLNASDTLGFGGIDDAKQVKSVIFVDHGASGRQRNALVSFAKKHAGRAGQAVMRIQDTPIEMTLDKLDLTGSVTAGDAVKLNARKARPGDCICSNESAYYPPLAQVTNFVPGVTIDGEFKGRGLGTRWSTPGARSAYLGTFAY